MDTRTPATGRFSPDAGDPPKGDLSGLLRAILALLAYAVLTGLASEPGLPPF